MGNNVVIDNYLPQWIDEKAGALIHDSIIVLRERHPDLLAVVLYGSLARQQERPLTDPAPSDVDLLAIFATDQNPMRLPFSLEVSRSLVKALENHLDVQREIRVMLASRSLGEWDMIYPANVARDGIVLFANGPLPAPLQQLQAASTNDQGFPQAG